MNILPNGGKGERRKMSLNVLLVRWTHLAYKLLAIIVIVALALFLFRFMYAKKKMFKATPFLHYGSDAHGIIFGIKNKFKLYSPENEEGHVLVVGGSGLGKTSALLIPTLNSWHGTSFTIDISGDICKNVNMPNKLVFEPEYENTIPYDIFAPIDEIDSPTGKNEALEELAILLMPLAPKADEVTRYYTLEGRKILTASLIAFYHTHMDFCDICKKIIENSYQNLFNAIDATENQSAINFINSFLGASPQNTAGAKQACDMAIKLFATNHNVYNSVRRPVAKENYFAPQKIEQHNVFVIIKDQKLELYEPLLRILTAQCLNCFSGRSLDKHNPILFSLDEFSSLGGIDITTALRKYRKRHIRVMVLTQSIADIDLLYGKDQRTAMIDNFKFIEILSARDPDTQDYFARMIGKKKVDHISTTRTRFDTSTTHSENLEYIIEPEKLANLGNEVILIHPTGYELMKKNFYFE